ncbi:MAG: primosomal protein N' [Veillonellaceae bacterium]|nr:primosomal protein N' [Veillonellaceae bacterium]
MEYVADIIVNRPAKQLNRTFIYLLPKGQTRIARGTRVLIPLGTTKEEGIVLRTYVLQERPSYQLKRIQLILDPDKPWFTEEMLGTANRLSHYYLCTYSEALSLFTINKKKTKTYERPKEEWFSASPFCQVEQLPKRKRRQRELLAYLIEKGPQAKSTLLAAGFSRLVINQIRDCLGIIVSERYKDTTTRYSKQFDEGIPLTQEQAQVYEPIQEALNTHQYKPFLLYGVTGSGKTQVYMKAAAQCIRQDKIAIVLVPEIILTNQIVKRFVDHFGDQVVVFHSKITLAERYNNWERLRRKDSHIIIGARSAVFAPTDDIGLIVVDEEHDTSYKQEDMLRYHARQVALWRGEAHQCPVILGSATPSIESYYRAQEGFYTLLRLPHRIHQQPMPKVTLVDMKEELLYGNYSVFSGALVGLLRRTLEKQEQMIILLNRRGYYTFVLCRECGQTITCPHCDVSMVYHKEGAELKCHYCDYHEPVPKVCPHCGSKKIKFFGNGTQKVEEELRRQFPGARVARLDQDVAAHKGRSEDVLEGFSKHQYDILLGTQMVAKGHDFPDVTAVGIVTADSVLNIPLYTASERTFDLLTQCAGRAGRGNKPGQVVIQTYNPLHYAIITSKAQDYEAFYKEEIKVRQSLLYPPVQEMIHMIVRQPNEVKTNALAEKVTTDLLTYIKTWSNLGETIEVFGPYEETVKKVRDLYRMAITIRGSHDKIEKIKEYIYTSWIFTQEGIVIDVDPI